MSKIKGDNYPKLEDIHIDQNGVVKYIGCICGRVFEEAKNGRTNLTAGEHDR